MRLSAAALPGPINPASLITSLRLLASMAWLSATSIRRKFSRFKLPRATCRNTARCRRWFTESLREICFVTTNSFLHSAGQSTFQIQMGISALVSSSRVTGNVEFGFNRNARPATKVKIAAGARSGHPYPVPPTRRAAQFHDSHYGGPFLPDCDSTSQQSANPFDCRVQSREHLPG